MSEITPPTPPASGTPPPAAAATTPAPAATPTDWTTGFNDETKGYVQNKGFKTPGDVLDSYRNFEKLMGTPKERILKLPEKEDDPAWGEIHERLGKPKDAKDYDIKVPEGLGDEEFAKWARGTFHELNLTKKQADALTAKWNEHVGGMVKTKGESYAQQVDAQQANLKKEWGAAHDQNLNIAKNAAREFGMEPKVIDALQDAMGYDGVMKFMHQIGSKIGEHQFIPNGGGGSGAGFGILSPAAAMNKIAVLKQDPGFVQRYTTGDAAARQELEQLHKWAYPDQ